MFGGWVGVICLEIGGLLWFECDYEVFVDWFFGYVV